MKTPTINVPDMLRVAKTTKWSVFAGILVSAIGLLAIDYYVPQSDGFFPIAGARTRPIVVTETVYSTKIVEKVVTRVVEIKVPTPAEEKKIEKKYQIDLSGLDLLQEIKLPELPNGGDAVLTIDASGQTSLVVKPDSKFFAFGGPMGFGAGPSWDSTRGLGLQLRAEKDLARVGRVRIQGGLDAFIWQTGGSDLRASVLAVYRR